MTQEEPVTSAVATPAAPDAQPQRGTSGNAPSQRDTPSDATDDIQNPAAKAAAQEAAAYRKQLRETQAKLAQFEEAQKQAELAKLSEQEKLQKKLAELQRTYDEHQAQTKQQLARAAVRVSAASVGIKPDLAARLIDPAEIEYGADGEPTNVPALLDALLTAYPELAAPATSATTSQATSSARPAGASATNPARSSNSNSGPVQVTADQYTDGKFRRDYKAAHGEDIMVAVSAGRAKIVY